MKRYTKPTPDQVQVAVMACWAHQHPTCWLCDQPAETHHIPCGPHLAGCRYDPVCCLRVCQQHHLGRRGMHNYREWPISRQLALKLEHDPQHYDRERVNEARHKAPGAISDEDVRKWLKPQE